LLSDSNRSAQAGLDGSGDELDPARTIYGVIISKGPGPDALVNQPPALLRVDPSGRSRLLFSAGPDSSFEQPAFLDVLPDLAEAVQAANDQAIAATAAAAAAAAVVPESTPAVAADVDVDLDTGANVDVDGPTVEPAPAHTSKTRTSALTAAPDPSSSAGSAADGGSLPAYMALPAATRIPIAVPRAAAETAPPSAEMLESIKKVAAFCAANGVQTIDILREKEGARKIMPYLYEDSPYHQVHSLGCAYFSPFSPFFPFFFFFFFFSSSLLFSCLLFSLFSISIC
jgi:hypothetical protein